MNMNCGVLCIREYLRLTGCDGDSILTALERAVRKEGLTVLDIIDVMSSYGFEVHCYRDKRTYYGTPFLMLDARKKHYYLITHHEKNRVFIYDPNLGYVVIPGWLYRFLWSEYYITLCYNFNNQRSHLWP